MNMHQSELQRQHKASQDIRARLMKPSPGDVVCRKEFDRIRAALQVETERRQEALKEIDDLKGRMLRKDYLIEHLELDKADKDARILEQAARICFLENDEVAKRSDKKPVRTIIAEVLAEFPDVTWEEISGIRRTRRLVIPRQRCMFEVSRQRPDLSLPAIGRIFGGRDHTTILHAVRKLRAAHQNKEDGQ